MVNELNALARVWRALVRHRLLAASVMIIVPVAVLLLSLRQDDRYESSAAVLAAPQTLANSLTGTSDSSFGLDEDRYLRTQSALADTPRVADRALADSGVTDLTSDQFLDSSEVTEETMSNLLTFNVQDADPQQAMTLATAWARAFAAFRKRLDIEAIVQAKNEVKNRLQSLDDPESSALGQGLLAKLQELNTLETLQTSSARVVQTATEATQIQPRPVRNTVLAAALALGLAILFSLVRDALDTRVRDLDEVEEILGTPRMTTLAKPLGVSNTTLELVTHPHSFFSEGILALRTQIELLTLDESHPIILVTSALDGEGKTSTVANIGFSLAGSGKSVLLIDMDLRRPTLNARFGAEPSPGLTDILLHRIAIQDAIRPVLIRSNNGAAPLSGQLSILTAGSFAAQPSAILGSTALKSNVADISLQYDFVILDSAPLLPVADSVAISAIATGMAVLLNSRSLRRHTLRDLRIVLDACPAKKLGFVPTGQMPTQATYYGTHSPSRPKEPALE